MFEFLAGERIAEPRPDDPYNRRAGAAIDAGVPDPADMPDPASPVED